MVQNIPINEKLYIGRDLKGHVGNVIVALKASIEVLDMELEMQMESPFWILYFDTYVGCS